MMARAMIRPRVQSWNQAEAATATTAAHNRPLRIPAPTSRWISQDSLFLLTCPRAIPRTITVSVWVPAMPPIEATIGISTASATTFSMVS